MTNKEILKKIEKLKDKQYKANTKIEEEISALEEQLQTGDLTLEQKYHLWLDSDDEPDYVVYLRDSCPVFFKLIDNWELNRYQTYQIDELCAEEIAEALYGDSEGTELTEEQREQWRTAIEELYKAGVTCFKFDW